MAAWRLPGHRWLVAVGLGALALATPARSDGKPGKPAPPPPTTLPPARIDDTLEVGGEAIAARRVASRLTVPVRVNGRGPYRFVVDSGADVSVIGRAVATTLGLTPAPPVRMNAMTESTQVQRARVGTLALGTSVLEDRTLPVLDEAFLGGDGLVGIDSLARQRLMLDFETRTVAIEDASERPKPMAGDVVVTARRRRGQLILTQVTANGRSLEAVIDTGSEITIGNSALRGLLIKRSDRHYATDVELLGVTGRATVVQIATFAELKIGSITFRNVRIAFADLPPFAVFGLAQQPALLLGTDLMEQFRRVSLDFRARRVRFQLRRCTEVGVRLSTGYRSRLIGEREEVCRR